MAIVFDAPVEPDDLTIYTRNVPSPDQFALTALFGDFDLVESNEVDWAEIIHTNRTARFRSYDGRIHVSERDAGSTSKVKLPALSTSLSMGEYERLQLQFARTGGTFTRALTQAIYNDGRNLTLEILARIEQAWGDTLMDGVLSIDENGYTSAADYGVPSSQIISAATAWTDTTNATALTNLVSAVDVYVANNGFAPGSMLTSLRMQRLFQQNKEVINAAIGSAAGRTRVRADEVRGLLDAEGLPQFRSPYDTNVDVDGTTTRVIADDKVIFLPPNPQDLGRTKIGISATALELVDSNESDMSFEEAPGIVGVVEKSGPPYRQGVFVDAVGMPVINGKLLMVLDAA